MLKQDSSLASVAQALEWYRTASAPFNQLLLVDTPDVFAVSCGLLVAGPRMLAGCISALTYG